MKRSPQNTLQEDDTRRQPRARVDEISVAPQESVVDLQQPLRFEYNTAENLSLDLDHSLKWTQETLATPNFVFTDWDLQSYQIETILPYTNSTTGSGAQYSPSTVCTKASENISATEKSETICFGMINEINCQLLMTVSPCNIDKLLNARSDDNFVGFYADIEPQRCTVTDEEGTPVFIVNSKFSKVLDDIVFLEGVTLQPYASHDQLLQVFESRPGKNQSRNTIRLHANLYGPRNQSELLGGILTKHEIFLQNPTWQISGLDYYNPQVIKFPHLSEVDIWLQSMILSDPSVDNALPVRDWDVVLDDLPQYHSAGSTDMANKEHMRTELFSHQLEAQDYMRKRETGDLEEVMRFWTLEANAEGVPIYRHTITGAEKYHLQTEPCGGILADHMGLGKTLSVISLIVSSRDRAAQFAQGHCLSSSSGRFPLTNTKTSLVVVPSVLLIEQWEREIEKHTISDTLKVTRYHGHDRAAHFSELQNSDVVLTTFGTVATEFRKSYHRGREALFYLHWFRIVLDEAHIIRSKKTRQFEAVAALQAQHNWCLTGTPVSNKIEDLAALLQFCRVPFLEDHKYFRDFVSKPARRSFPQGCRILRQLLSPLCLRRTKTLLDIPQPRMIQLDIQLSDSEKRRYQNLEDYHRRKIIESVSSHDNRKNLQHTMLQAILSLRICCNQGTYMTMPLDSQQHEYLDPDEALTLLEEKSEAICAQCSSEVPLINQLEDPGSGTLGTCSHMLCGPCFDLDCNGDNRNEYYTCPTCQERAQMQMLSYEPSQPKPLLNDDNNQSAKLNRLMEDLAQHQHSEKSIVFSVWKKTLDITSQLCQAAGIKHVRIDGSVSQAHRSIALDTFTNDTSMTILLMTLGTGALGLNLTAASRIHILEPQWNPAVEDQAIGRAVRIGQEQNATILRYMVENSVEQQIQTYQRRKRNLIAGGFGETDKYVDVENKILKVGIVDNGKREPADQSVLPIEFLLLRPSIPGSNHQKMFEFGMPTF